MKWLIVTYLVFYNILLCFGQDRKTYHTKKIETSIAIDGHFDERSWAFVPWAKDFIQTDPNNGEAPSFETQFKILYDNDNLYVAIQAFDSAPDSIVISQRPRDFFAGDYVEINIDSDFDRSDAFSFTVTAAGIRGDEHIISSDNWWNDWNPIWQTATTVNQNGWSAELKIPFTELDIDSVHSSWGIQVNRSIERLDEGSSWTSVPDEDQWVQHFGILKGIDNISIPSKISIHDTLPLTELRDDLEKLLQSLQLCHPSLYRYRSPKFIIRQFERAINELDGDMTIVDFYKIVSTVISNIGDGHMSVDLPNYLKEQFQNQSKLLPFDLRVTAEGTFIEYASDEDLDNARLLSINGRSMDEIVNDMSNLVSSDGYNLTGKYYHLSKQYGFYLSLIQNIDETVEIDIVPPGKTTVQSLKLDLGNKEDREVKRSNKVSNASTGSFDYQLEGDIGILTIKTFNHAEGFKHFVDSSFQKLAEAKAEKLILDFRGNGGGEETNAIYLYRFLAGQPFQYYDRYQVNVNPESGFDKYNSLISYETLVFFNSIATLDSNNRFVIANFEELDGYLIHPDDLHYPMKENHFDGPVVVLIDGGSFSATSELAAIMKRDARATFIGAETGGAFEGNTSGMYDQITLPFSGIHVRIPLIQYVSAVENVSFLFGRGVIPDYDLNPFISGSIDPSSDSTLSFAIDFLLRQ